MMSRFVILRHTLPPYHPRPSHWDLLIQRDDRFDTWWLECWPESAERVPAMELAAHRLEYWELEGSLSADRGEIVRIDRGNCEIVENRAICRRIELLGTHHSGTVELSRREPEDPHWEMRFLASQ